MLRSYYILYESEQTGNCLWGMLFEPMLEIKDRSRIRKRLYSPQVFFVLLVLTLIILKATLSVYWKRAESIQNLAKVTEQANALQSRQTELSANIEKLQTQSGVETEIRKKFSVVKNGEQMVVLVDDQKKTSLPPLTQKGFFARVWDSITGIFGHTNATTSSTISSSEVIKAPTNH